MCTGAISIDHEDLARVLALSPLFAVLVGLCRPVATPAGSAPALAAANGGLQMELVRLLESVLAVVTQDRSALLKCGETAPLSLAEHLRTQRGPCRIRIGSALDALAHYSIKPNRIPIRSDPAIT